MKNDNVISCNNVVKVYKGKGDSDVYAIQGVDLEIESGEFTVIMGNSGSGKSTLLYMMSGLDSITEGEVYLDGKEIGCMNEEQLALYRRNKVGFVFQGINLVPNLSLKENVLVAGYIGQKCNKEVEKKAIELLESMELKEKMDYLPCQVSGGQQQRAAIARALINSPKVLFADEPTGALNHTQGQNVIRLLEEVNEKGQTIVMVTHDMKLACSGSRVIFIRDGKLCGDIRFKDKIEFQELEEKEKFLYSWLVEKGW